MKFLPLLALVLLWSSCGTKRTTSPDTGTDAVTISAAEKVMQQMQANSFEAEWVDARANMKVESPQMNVGGTAYIRMQKDKKIWMSVKKFGFEAARALITPDSFFVIDRLNNEFTAEPLSYIEEKYKLPARFDLLQEIILGNPIFFDRNLEVSNIDDTYQLSGRNGRYISDYYLNGTSFRLNSMRLKERATERVVNVFMDDYQETDTGQTFAVKRSIEMESPTDGLAKVEMDFGKISFNQAVDMPFSVPRKFDRGR